MADEENPLIETISTADDMLGGESRERYFAVGRSALHCIRTALSAARCPEPRRILDLPSGHGRVLRHLRAAFPTAEITACDLSTEAIEFCASAFAAIPVASKTDVGQVSLPGPYDLIWCGSLLTHLGERDWDALISRFDAILSPTGVLVASTHGRLPAHYLQTGARNYGLDAASVARLLSDYDRSGFGHVPYDPAGTYGLSLSRPSWVVSYLERWPGLRLATFTERGWDDHHDVIACVRSATE